jgi:UDP-N-acetylmuramoyl-L-alanine---L-glutamate ligase
MAFQQSFGAHYVKISELENKRVAIWGYGREGRAALAAIRSRLHQKSITIFCNENEAQALALIEDPNLIIETEISPEKLSAFEVVIKSPGISPYTSPAMDAHLHGTQFIGGTGLWFAENPYERCVCVTGTKGKSTVTSLIAHLLRSVGRRTALAGNIGMPLLELLDVDPPAQFWAIELSSYQTREVSNPEVAVILNFFPEHLDWHGNEQRYFDDKMALATASGARNVVLNAADARLVALASSLNESRIHWFNRSDTWHLRETTLYRGEQWVMDLRNTPLAGFHNRVNYCAALVAIEALGLNAVAMVQAIHTFKPLPHRLQHLGSRDGLQFINDSISTTPHASLAALDSNKGVKLAIIVGGYDRGIDWGVFADRMAVDPPKCIITMGQNGTRIFERLKPLTLTAHFALHEAKEMEDAIRIAREVLENEGAVLLSPGAPSFPRYKDYVERGKHFAKAAGFDPDLISAIPGMGIS